MILEAIYSGEIYPAETVVPESDEFSHANEEISRTMNFFQEKLSHEDYTPHHKYVPDCQPVRVDMSVRDYHRSVKERIREQQMRSRRTMK